MRGRLAVIKRTRSVKGLTSRYPAERPAASREIAASAKRSLTHSRSSLGVTFSMRLMVARPMPVSR